MEIIKKIEKLLAENPDLNLVIEPDQCDDNHTIWVIRCTGTEGSGLVVMHMDEHFLVEKAEILVTLLTPKFLNKMISSRFLNGFYYIEYVQYLNMMCIAIMDPDVEEHQWVYWSHLMQNVLEQV